MFCSYILEGSAVDKLEEIIGYVSIGYPFGLTASILFGRHFEMEGPNYDAQMVDLILGFLTSLKGSTASPTKTLLGNSRTQTHTNLRGSATCLLHGATGLY
jgi:hypothetical protein